MTKSVPLVGAARISFRGQLMAWAGRMALADIARHPGTAPARIRSLIAQSRQVETYLSHLKPVRFGRRIKIGMYLPCFPSEALAGRIRRGWANCRTLTPFEQVMLSVTDRCFYRCNFCFNTRKTQPPMPIQRLRKLVGELQDVSASWICIHGGEPMVDFERTLAVVEAADKRSEVWVATTGYDLTAERARQLRKAGLFAALIAMHHHVPAEHDAIVGYKGAFEIATTAMKRLQDEGIFTCVNTVLPAERITHEEIDRMMDLTRRLAAPMLEVLVLRPAGSAVNVCAEAQPTGREIQVIDEAMMRYNRTAAHGGDPALTCPGHFETPSRFGCIGGFERIFISAAGDLQPCSMVNLSVGNVAEEGFAAVGERMLSLVPQPRSELMCTALQSIIAEKCGDGDTTQLPLPPEISLPLLKALPPSELPKAFGGRGCP